MWQAFGKYWRRIALFSAFLLVIVVPGGALMLMPLFSDDHPANEDAPTRPRFSWPVWLVSDYQRRFEPWLSQGYFGRSKITRARQTASSIIASAEFALFGDKGGSMPLTGAKAEVVKTAMADLEKFSEPKYPEYIRKIAHVPVRTAVREYEDTVLGKDGVLFSASSINELFGMTPAYSDCADDKLRERVKKLRFIQDTILDRGKAFALLITPSKAAHYAEYIPGWYLDRYVAPKGYVRPYTRFLAMLKEEGVEYVDSSAVLAENGVANSFPITGSRWTLMSSLPVVQRLIDLYMDQMEKSVRQVAITGFDATAEPRFGERDLYDALYSTRASGRADAAVDPVYYYPLVKVVDASVPPIDNVMLQGGSFLEEPLHWFNTVETQTADAEAESANAETGIANTETEVEDVKTEVEDAETEVVDATTGIAKTATVMSYNRSQDMNWNDELWPVSYFIIEVNEQFVYDFGGPGVFKGSEYEPLQEGLFNTIDYLYRQFSGSDDLAALERVRMKKDFRDDRRPEAFYPEYRRENVPSPVFPVPEEDCPPGIVAGKDGMLFDAGSINELYGLTPKYVNVTDETLRKRAEQIGAIERAVRERGTAFALLITPSKASQYPENIPDSYLAEHAIPTDYVRPYTRFLPMLEENGVSVVDTRALLDKLGITNTFTHSGAYWNLIASAEASKALIALYEKQKNISLFRLKTIGMKTSAERNIFSVYDQKFDREQNLLDEVYPQGTPQHDEAADPLYYRPDVKVTNFRAGTAIAGIRVQGGEVRDDVLHWLVDHDIAYGPTTFHYNTWEENWERLLKDVAFLILEVNEQAVFNIGGSKPGVGVDDAFEPEAGEYNFIEALYGHLVGGSR